YSGIESLTIHGEAGDDTIVDPGRDTHIFGDAGNDTITVNATSGNGVTVDGGSGTNSVQVQLGQLLAPVTVQNSDPTGHDALAVVATGGAVDVAGSQVISGSQTIQFSAAVSSLAVSAAAGNNQVTIAALTNPLDSLAVSSGDGNNSIAISN